MQCSHLRGGQGRGGLGSEVRGQGWIEARVHVQGTSYYTLSSPCLFSICCLGDALGMYGCISIKSRLKAVVHTVCVNRSDFAVLRPS